MKKLRAIIIDDERNARENLEMLLNEYCPEIEVAAKGNGIQEGRQLIESLTPEVVFLDIRMPSGAEGFDLLKQFRDHKFLVVFVTAFKEYAIEAFNANAVHYILKPVDIEELIIAVQKVVKQSEQFQAEPQDFFQYKEKLETVMNQIVLGQQRIPIHHSRGIKFVASPDIEFVSADGNCALIQLKNGSKFLDTRTLKTYEKLLPENYFFRVHRSYIVNVHMVDELIRADGVWLLMKCGKKIPVSRSRLSAFLKAIKAV